MQTVPNIVRERLKAKPPVGSHPDTDVLTAFAERSLPELERAIVLEHMARCGDCRDVIALALPETEAMLPAPSPVRSPWQAWPALRWGLVAAGIVVVASFGVLQFQRRPGRAAFVAKQSLPEGVAIASRTEPATHGEQPAREQSERDSERDKDSAGARSGDSLSAGRPKTMLVAPKAATGEIAHGALVADTAGRSRGGPIQSGPKMPAQWQQAGPARILVPVPAAPSAVAKQQSQNPAANNIPAVSETVEVQASTPQMETEASTATLRAQAGGQESTGGQSSNEKSSDEAAFKVDKAKAATASPAESTQVTVMAAQSQMETVVLDAHAIPPRWTITAAGGLQRSIDQGNSWENVDVSAAPIQGRNFTSLEILENSRASKKEEKQTKDAAAAPAASPAASPALVFRAVAATGPQVWVGGSGGILYHSVDAGNEWTRVVPASGGMVLTGDIVGVEFSDAQHGKIRTSTAEVWSTGDAGQTWQKQ